jgi:hypothetical protein
MGGFAWLGLGLGTSFLQQQCSVGQPGVCICWEVFGWAGMDLCGSSL